MRLILVWLALLAALVGAPAAALQQFPAAPAGPVADAANIIPDADEALLDVKLRGYNQRTGRALVVATVPSLGGDTIEDYAVRLFQAWGIGGKESDSGLLLLVAPAEHKVRIEVGYGLHQYVTDILSGRIIREQVTPQFKAGNYPAGINAGVDALIQQLDRTPADAKAVTEAAAAQAAQKRSGGGGFPLGGIIFWIVLIVFFSGLFGRRRGGGRAYRGGSGIGNVIMWSALNAAMNSGRGGGGGFGGGGGDFGGGGGGFGGFGGGGSGGGGASGSW